jgi:hypothetical protein
MRQRQRETGEEAKVRELARRRRWERACKEAKKGSAGGSKKAEM